MAMSKETRRQLGKAYELLWLLLDDKKCYFCKKPVLDSSGYGPVKFGNASAPPIELDITEHHIDGNHSNNGRVGDRSNLALAHESCHKSFHAKRVFKAWRKGVVGSSGVYGR